MDNSATALQPVLLEPGQEEFFDGTLYRTGRWLTEDNWPGFSDNVYFNLQVFYTDHLEMLREYAVIWKCFDPADDWEGMFLYERGYERAVRQIGQSE